MDTVEKALTECCDDFSFMLRGRYEAVLKRLDRKPESKIEEAFLAGVVFLDYGNYIFDLYGYSEETFFGRMMAARPWVVKLTCQAPILEYRADFLVEVVRDGGTVGSIVVECDGHDFHERTKEQAQRDRQRDRKMTIAGYQVMRFTGSEIYRSAGKCAHDLWSAIFEIALATKK